MDDPNEAFKGAIQDANPAQFPDFSKVNAELKAKAAQPVTHLWRQRGPELICTSCTYEHGQWIGMDKILTGFDEGGKPILKQR